MSNESKVLNRLSGVLNGAIAMGWLSDDEAAELRRQHAEIESLRAQLADRVPDGVFAWATFDGEGGYDLRLHEGNESYRDDYIKLNGEKYASWVFPLSAAPSQQAPDAPAGSGGWQFHAEDMERQRDYWQSHARLMREHQQGECWYWQGDGGDHPESMASGLPVVIRADQLRALMQRAPQPTEKEAQLVLERDSARAAYDRQCRVTNEAYAKIRKLEQAAQQAPVAQGEPVAWLVCGVNKDGSLSLEHAAAWQEAAHEHINDAITEHGIEDAATWVVRPAYTTPQQASTPMTVEQIWENDQLMALNAVMGLPLQTIESIVGIVERHHNIKGKQ